MGITGASGMPYAAALLRALAGRRDVELHAVVSDAALKVMGHEPGLTLKDVERAAAAIHAADDIAAPPASGTWRHEGMIVCPCSMATLAAVAHGMSDNLIHRAADVCLKERLPLVLVPRETPLSVVHLRNMLAAAEAGAVILPAMPGFYQKPSGLEGLADSLAGKILDQLGIDHDLSPRWTEEA